MLRSKLASAVSISTRRSVELKAEAKQRQRSQPRIGPPCSYTAASKPKGRSQEFPMVTAQVTYAAIVCHNDAIESHYPNCSEVLSSMDAPPQRINRARFKLPDGQKDVKDVAKTVNFKAPGKPLAERSTSGPREAVSAPAPCEDPNKVVTPLRNRGVTPTVTDPLTVTQVTSGEHALSGKLICFATDLHSMLQEEAERRVEAAGGKVGPAVGQRTSYLVMGGKTVDGRPPEESPKYQRLLQLQKMGKAAAQVLSEAEFLKLLPASRSPAKVEATKVEAAKVEAAMTASPCPPNQQKPAAPAAGPAGPAGPAPFNWVDVFAPFQLNQLIGNSAVAQRLADWLQSWDAVVLQGRKKVASPPSRGSFENVNVGLSECCRSRFSQVESVGKIVGIHMYS